jgi:hypothetical protein
VSIDRANAKVMRGAGAEDSPPLFIVNTNEFGSHQHRGFVSDLS